MVLMDLNKVPEEDESTAFIMLYKDGKPISQVSCSNSPVKIPVALHVKEMTPAAILPLSKLPRVYFHAAGQNRQQSLEFETFLGYLLKRDKVAVCHFGWYEFLITPPSGSFDRVGVAYRLMKLCRDGEVLGGAASNDNRIREPMAAQVDAVIGPQNPTLYTRVLQDDIKREDSRSKMVVGDAYLQPQNFQTLHTRLVKGNSTQGIYNDHQQGGPYPNVSAPYEHMIPLHRASENVNRCIQSGSPRVENNTSPRVESNPQPLAENASHQTEQGTIHRFQTREVKQESSETNVVRRKFSRTHPEYLETLSHNHAQWIFGALAELIDNSRDANASRLDISIQMEYHKKAGKKIPVLAIVDNGCGMTHSDIERMLSFGHKRPSKENKDLIGRFGVGFKTGSMRLGKDVVVFTQSSETRSIAFLSQSFNEDKDDVEIPIITYRKEGGYMDFDLTVHTEQEAEAYLKAMKEYSPFNEYVIGNKFARFREDGTGTHIYVYNLDMWGSDYSLQWDDQTGESKNSRKKRDIWIRSRRVRSRPGQMSQEVPLDYSLHAYLEVIFLDPRMKIYVQGSMVKIRPLAKSLNKTRVVKDVLLGKTVELTLGRSQEERERGNCGVFLYWHGRLIEAYKRVGGMIHSADMGRGVIGVIDVTEIMTNGDKGTLVLNHKQGFQDCAAYAKLEQWLGSKADEYWDENFDTLELRDNSKGYKPDHEWVQCNKCWKWRLLDPSYNSENLPDEWFCYMVPFKGSCSILEQAVEPGVITVGAKRSNGGFITSRQLRPVKEEGNVTPIHDSVITNNKGESETSTDTEVETNLPVIQPPLKRLRRGPPRASAQRRAR